MEFPKILVLTDYTQAAKVAVEHALQLANKSRSEVVSLHYVKEFGDLEWAWKKSDQEIRNASNFSSAIEFQCIAEEQNLFEGAERLSDTYGTSLTFMGTHGKKDIQFITGSHALKIIHKSASPTMVVQRDSPIRPYQNILFPILGDGGEQSKHLDVVGRMAQLNQGVIHLLYPTYADDGLRNQLIRELIDTGEHFEEAGIENHSRNAEVGLNKFAQSILSHASDVKADLIVLPSLHTVRKTSDSDLKALIQRVITNKQQIPTLCL